MATYPTDSIAHPLGCKEACRGVLAPHLAAVAMRMAREEGGRREARGLRRMRGKQVWQAEHPGKQVASEPRDRLVWLGAMAYCAGGRRGKVRRLRGGTERGKEGAQRS